jgi:hypothetical protein
MGIRFLCPNGHKLNVKAELAGKRASCPECGVKLVIPAASLEPAVVAPAAAIVVDQSLSPPPPPDAVWYLRTTGGEQLGPATESQLCNWIVAGRVTADAHVRRDGWAEWKLVRDAADALPMPLAAMPVAAPPVAAAPIVPAPPPPPSINSVPRPDLDLAAAEPVASNAIVTDPALLAASTYALQQRRGKQAQLTLAVVMLVAVIVLAGVLVLVVRSNVSTAPQSWRSDYPHFSSASAANC